MGTSIYLICLLAVGQTAETNATPQAEETSSPQQEAAPQKPAGPSWVRGALELSALAFPDGAPSSLPDVFALVEPILAFNPGDAFRLELGAPLRLRLLDQPPEQRNSDIGGRSVARTGPSPPISGR